MRLGLPPFRAAFLQLRGGHQQLQLSFLHVELDQVAVFDQRERAPRRGLGRDVQDHGAVRGAAHARVRDAHHVGDAFLQYLGRQRHVADLGHAGIALRPAVLEHHHAAFVDVELRVVDARVEVLDALEHHRAAAVLHELGRGGGWFYYRAVRAEVAAQYRDPGVLLERLLERRNDVAIPARRVLHVLPHRLAVHRERAFPQQSMLAELTQHDGQAAGVVEVLHQVLARRHEVDERVHAAPEAREVLEVELDADAARDRREMDYRVGRAADRRERADGIFEGFLGKYF